MEDNIDIFIGTYKDFKPQVTNKAYKIIVGNHDVNIDTDLEVIKCGDKNDVLDDTFYSEIYMLKKLVDMNYPFKDYVGFCHYRKYFSFMNDVPDMESEEYSKYDAIISLPLILRKSNIEQYGSCHNIKDIGLILKIIFNKYPSYSNALCSFLFGKRLIPYNMFIMKREDFIEYINFVWDVLQDYVNIVGTDIKGKIEREKEEYLKKFSPNDTIEYQYRIGGYLAERLTNVFIIKKFNKVCSFKAEVTENKYDIEFM